MLIQNLFANNVKANGLQLAKFLDGYSPIFSQFGRSIYASDVVQMCIDCIATECSKLTPQHVTIDDNGLPAPLQGDNFNRLFRFAPNGLMSTREFIEKVIWLLYLNYNAFIYPVYNTLTDSRGNVSRYYTAFYPLNPIQVEFLQDAVDKLFVRFYFFNGNSYTLPYADVIHLRKKYSVNDIMGGGINGQPDNTALLKVLETNDIVLQGIGKAIKTTLAVRGILKINTLMDDEKQKAERLRFEQAIGDGVTGILPMDMKGEYLPLTIDPKLIDKDTLEFLENKVLRWFGVSLPIINGDYNDEQYQAFYNKTIEPIVIGLGQAFSGAIFSQREQDIGHEIKFYQLNLELMDTKNKMAFVQALGDRGILTDNQILALFGMAPYDGGNVRHMSLNYIDASLANTYQMLKVKGNDPRNIGETGGKQ
ncbi:MAG TPA: phage portal protein [Desulfitobacteriaceae bacterium]|nr:phage portal protein [Desulfitobacteriaceae bacterium]